MSGHGTVSKLRPQGLCSVQYCARFSHLAAPPLLTHPPMPKLQYRPPKPARPKRSQRAPSAPRPPHSISQALHWHAVSLGLQLPCSFPAAFPSCPCASLSRCPWKSYVSHLTIYECAPSSWLLAHSGSHRFHITPVSSPARLPHLPAMSPFSSPHSL